jgi:hypothetical protein
MFEFGLLITLVVAIYAALIVRRSRVSRSNGAREGTNDPIVLPPPKGAEPEAQLSGGRNSISLTLV